MRLHFFLPMTERVHHRTQHKEITGNFLGNDRRGAKIQFKAEDGGVVLVPETCVQCPLNTPVVVIFEVHQEIQDRVSVVWSEEVFAELETNSHEILLEGRYKVSGKKKKKQEAILCDGIASPHQSFILNGGAERNGTFENGDEVVFLPAIANIRKAIDVIVH